MVDKKETGNKGEDLAAAYLKEKGFAILARNWRHRRLEIDIVAERDNRIRFVEVKTRSTNQFGYPEKAIGRVKMANMMRAAEAFLAGINEEMPIQFDVVSITLEAGGCQIYHIEDLFF